MIWADAYATMTTIKEMRFVSGWHNNETPVAATTGVSPLLQTVYVFQANRRCRFRLTIHTTVYVKRVPTSK